MIIDPKNTYVAYRCPDCGKGVVSSVGIFSLNADMLRLKCECGGSEMTVVSSSDGHIRLTVPCIMCPKPHNFSVSKSIFFGRELFMLQCPYTDINLCFLGERDKVSAGLERTELELLDMLGEDNLERLGNKNSELLSDPQIFDIVMFVIRDLEAENKITCHCPDGHASCSVEILDDAVRVFCKKCGASQSISTDSLLGAHAFLHCDRLNLD